MTLRRLIGFGMLVAPFAVIIGGAIYTYGWYALAIFIGGAVLFGWLRLGLYLIEPS